MQLSDREAQKIITELAQKLILNLVKTKNEMGTDLANIVVEGQLCDEQNPEEFKRNKFTEAELGQYIGELFTWFPRIKWTALNISSALFCDFLDIKLYLEKLNNDKTNN